MLSIIQRPSDDRPAYKLKVNLWDTLVDSNLTDFSIQNDLQHTRYSNIPPGANWS